MPVTLQQIADKAGVTRSQVSRVLNGRYKENRPAIAQRAQTIRQIADQLGYRPNLAARSVSEGKFGQVAFVTCGDLGFDWFAPELLHGIHQGLDAASSRLMINELSGEQLADPNNMPRLFRESGVDAMLVNVDAKLPPTIVEMFDAQPVPAVLLNQKKKTRCVYPDEREGGRAAVRYLVGQGRQNLGFVCLQSTGPSSHFSCRDRLDGYRDAMEEAGLDSDAVLLEAVTDWDTKGNGEQMMDAFLEAHADLDAVVCYSLPEAGMLCFAAAKRGIRLPDDLRVVVFNHEVAHAQTGIPVDTMMVPFKQVGMQAVDMVMEMVNDGSTRRPLAVCVPYETIYIADRCELVPLADVCGQAKGAGD